MSEIIEEVAKAIAFRICEDPDKGWWAWPQNYPEEIVDKARDAARDAIEAMREPTAKMCAAAAAAMSPGYRPTMGHVSNREKHAIRYRAMIDTALGREIDAKIDAALGG